MAPISHGSMYASINEGISLTYALRVLFLGEHVSGVVQSLDVLHDYLEDINKTNINIVVHTVISNMDTTNSTRAVIISLDTKDKGAVLRYAAENDIDIIHDADGLFTKKERFKRRESYAITTTLADLTKQLESHLSGNAVPWNFNDPVWHTNWIYKYTNEPGVGKQAFGLISIGQEKGYSEKQMEFVRALANKSIHIEHAREQLYHYLQLKRRAFRMGNNNNDFSFELTYHLTNYSVYICSAMDILARLINEKYELGYGRFQSYGITKTTFIQRLSSKRKTLADIFARKKFQDWADWMFVRRNNITHESNLYLTPLMRRKETVLTAEELEEKVDAEFNWEAYTRFGLASRAAGMKSTVRQLLDLQLNYEQVVTDMMTLERVDRVTGQTQNYIVFPLRAIDDDYEKVNDVITRAINNLSRARS